MEDYKQIEQSADQAFDKIKISVERRKIASLILEELYTHLEKAKKNTGMGIKLRKGFFTIKLEFSYSGEKYNPFKTDQYWTMEEDSIGRCIILYRKRYLHHRYNRKYKRNIISIKI